MRGALDRVLKQGMPIRIIPADAGSTTTFYSACGFSQDHPRGCGEHGVPCLTITCTRGSSPRMRGALVLVRLADASTRIIPADAGSTIGADTVRLTDGDHPRGCGEHIIWLVHTAIGWGSSPRMRGAQAAARLVCRCQRIIPADAGSTETSVPGVVPAGDHPRGCGEHIFFSYD